MKGMSGKLAPADRNEPIREIQPVIPVPGTEPPDVFEQMARAATEVQQPDRRGTGAGDHA